MCKKYTRLKDFFLHLSRIVNLSTVMKKLLSYAVTLKMRQQRVYSLHLPLS